MTRLQALMHEQRATYTQIATRAQLQPRTVRMLATGETALDNVSVNTVRRIASALSVPVATLLEEATAHSGDDSRPRSERLGAAIASTMWPTTRRAYLSPVEADAHDDIADANPDEFFAGMTPINARRG